MAWAEYPQVSIAPASQSNTNQQVGLFLTVMAPGFMQPCIHADRQEFCSREQRKNSHNKSQFI